MTPITESDSAPVVVLDYSRPTIPPGVFDPRCRDAARLMVGLAVLSGLCVAVCFAGMFWGIVGAMLQAGVFVATLVVAIRIDFLLGVAGLLDARQRVLDLIAGIALVQIAITHTVVRSYPELNWDKLSAVIVGVAFISLAATTYRHVLLYRTLHSWAVTAVQISFSRLLERLGNSKATFEAIWFGCCAFCIFAIGFRFGDEIAVYPLIAALVGCGIYGLIWIWMIVVHARLAASMG